MRDQLILVILDLLKLIEVDLAAVLQPYDIRGIFYGLSEAVDSVRQIIHLFYLVIRVNFSFKGQEF